MVRYRKDESGQGPRRENRKHGGSMSIEIEDLVDAEANRSDQALAIVLPTTIIRPAAASAMLVPRLIADAGENASLRFLDFFTANIRNPNTRAAYAVAAHEHRRLLSAGQTLVGALA